MDFSLPPDQEKFAGEAFLGIASSDGSICLTGEERHRFTFGKDSAMKKWFVFLAFSLLSIVREAASEEVSIVLPSSPAPRVRFGAGRLAEALQAQGVDASIRTAEPFPGRKITLLKGEPEVLGEEGFRIQASNEEISIAARGDSGILYGALEICDLIRKESQLPAGIEMEESPRMSLRGICLFLMKQGTYDHPIAPGEFPWFFQKDLWLKVLDALATARLNAIYLWNGHPFPYLLELPKYPEAAMLNREELARNVEMFRWLTSEADKRGIWVVMMFYNIHLSPNFAKAHGLPVHLRAPHPLASAYTRYCLKEFVEAYPSVGLLACLGEALGEQKGEWLRDTLIEGIKESGRRPPFIVRKHFTNVETVRDFGVKHYDNLYTMMKYNEEVVHSTRPDPAHKPWVELKAPHVVNIHEVSDIQPFRWGSPSFVREACANMLDMGVEGIHVYAQWSWQWPYSADRTDPRLLQIDRDWPWYEAWGRYSWNPHRGVEEEKEYWSERLGAFFGSLEAGAALLEAYDLAGRVLPGIQAATAVCDWNAWFTAEGATFFQLLQAPISHIQVPVERPLIKEYTQRKALRLPVSGSSPVGKLRALAAAAAHAVDRARQATRKASKNREELNRLIKDLEATHLAARFYLEKAGAVEAFVQFVIDQNEGGWKHCLERLQASVETFRELARRGEEAYLAVSNKGVNYPYPMGPNHHWRDVLPRFEAEVKEIASLYDDLKGLATSSVFVLTDGKNSKLGALPHEMRRKRGWDQVSVVSQEIVEPAFLKHLKGKRLLLADDFIRTGSASTASSFANEQAGLPEHSVFSLYRREILGWVEEGGCLALWQLDWPRKVDPSFFPFPITFSDDDGNELLFSQEDHPLTRGFAGTQYRAGGCAGDAVKNAAPEWKVLCTSPAGRHVLECSYGKGKIALLQFREPFSTDDAATRQMARNLLVWAELAPEGEAGPGACVSIEIEDLKGSWREQTNIPGYSGQGFRTSNARGVSNDPLAGSFQVEQGGKYFVWVRGYEGDQSDRRFQVEIDGKLMGVTHRGRSGESFTWQFAGGVDLRSGKHAIRILDGGDGYETADAVLLTTAGGYDPEMERMKLLAFRGSGAAKRQPIEYVVERTQRLQETRKIPSTLEEWEKERAAIRAGLLRGLGLDPLPERTPLNAKILREVKKDGYTIQHLTFESRPNFMVTANLYLPGEISGPLPAVVCPCGHWGRSKMESVVQARCIGLAKQGFIVLVYDPFGQGERRVPGNEHMESALLMLTGKINLSFMIWDTIRAIDYLQSREDVDPLRIGCTGASGGGLNTLYASAIDERIQCSVPTAFYFGFEEFLGLGEWHCPCNHIPGLLRIGGMREMAALIAPRTLLINCATRDELFPIRSARETFGEVRRIYELYGEPERVSFAEADATHTYNKPMREAMYGWMIRHLQGRGDGKPQFEPAMQVEEPPFSQLLCFPDGNLPPCATVRDFAQREAREAIGRLPGADCIAPESLRRDLCFVLRLESLQAPPQLELMEVEYHGMAALVGRVQSDPAIEIPVVYFPLPGKEKGGDSPPVVVYIEPGRTAAEIALSLVPHAHRAGLAFLWIDCRGWGETAHSEAVLATDGVLLGDPLLTQRIRDVLAAAEAFGISEGKERKAILWGKGMGGAAVALFGGALSDRFTAVACDGIIGSFMDLFTVPGIGYQPIYFLPNILRVADIPQAAALIPPRTLILRLDERCSEDSLGESGKILKARGVGIRGGEALQFHEVFQALQGK